MAVRQPARVAFASVVLGVVLVGASPALAAGAAGGAPRAGTAWPALDPSDPPGPTGVPTVTLSPGPEISGEPSASVPPAPSAVPSTASPSASPTPSRTPARRTQHRPAVRMSVARDAAWNQGPAAPPTPVVAPPAPVQLLPSRPSAAEAAVPEAQDTARERDRLPESMIMAGAGALVFAGTGLVLVGRRRRTW